MAAIILWNTVYLGRVVEMLRSQGEINPDELLGHLGPWAGGTSTSPETIFGG